MECPACHVANPEANRFCMGCGSALERSCASCGASAPPEARFCGACGTALESPGPVGGGGAPAGGAEKLAPTIPEPLAQKIRETRGRIEGERRQVTVLFCDLTESTRIAEKLGPEIYRDLLGDYLERASGSVHRYEGVINQLAGDGFMAIFGAPIAHDDDAARACRAALAIQTEMRGLARDWRERLGEDLAARIGINTGLAIVGSIGSDLRMDYSAIGDTTNVASRIEAAAPAGQALVSAATRKLVAHHFETEEFATEAFKGKSEKVTVYRLVREVPRSERRHQALRSGLAPHLGRQTELALLRERFEEARAGQGQVLFLGGEAGIGKSRLIHEFRRQLEPGAFAWLEGQCVSYGSRVAHWPVADLLRGFFEVEESDSASLVAEKVQRRCREIGGPVKDAEPFFRDLLGIEPGDERLSRMSELLKSGHIFESIRNLLHTLAREHPVILLVEDVHWVDPSSEVLLRRLFDTVATARALVLVTHRPEYAWPHAERSFFGRLQLRGLAPAQVAQLAGSVLSQDVLPESVARVVAERSDGNPFFVEEVTKSLSERGLLEGVVDPGELWKEVPSTVQEVILARIDRLDDAAKRTLQMAAVIGREFTVRVLERIAEQRSEAPVLDELSGLELIYEKATYPELAYMFKHALTHDVAYGTLLESQRRALHDTVARLIEELYADRLPEFYETLALQYRRAERPERAAHYALLAAERAARHLAPEAEDGFRQAAEWSSGREECLEIAVRAQLGLGDQLIRRGAIDAANAAFEAAHRAAEEPGTRHQIRNKIVERRFVEREGVRIAFYIHGEGRDAPDTVPFVVLHPAVQGSFAFQDLAQRLCQEHTVIYLDPRGIGASDDPGGEWSFADRVEDALAVLHALPYPRYVLNGDSDGVPMVLQVREAIPERVDRLVLFGFPDVGVLAPGSSGEAIGRAEAGIASLFFEPELHTALENFFRVMGDEPGMAVWSERVLANWEKCFTSASFRAFVREAVSFDLRPLLARVDVPTLVVAAERDAIPVASVRALAEQIRGARYALIEGVSHFAPFTATETFAEIVRSFLHGGDLPREVWRP
jgi:class 3 adenylate cyclase/pimeloyl-ACP methyl ester carboxylesterase